MVDFLPLINMTLNHTLLSYVKLQGARSLPRCCLICNWVWCIFAERPSPSKIIH